MSTTDDRAGEGLPRPPVHRWKPPWPPVRIAEGEWIIMRDSNREPVGVIRAVKLGPRKQTFFRVVTWAPTSQGRTLVGYYDSLADADTSIKFDPPSPVMPDVREASGWGIPPGAAARPAHEVSDGKANTPARVERD